MLDPEYGAADPAPGGLPRLVRFVEKPDAGTAARMLAEGRHLWNAGIFLASAATLRAAFARHAPQMLAAVERAVREAVCDLGFTRLAPSPWAGITDISVDYAVMEKADNLSVMPYAGAWSDLGGWDALWRESGPDAAGMVTQGNVLSLGCEGSLLRSESGGLELVGIGLRDVIAVAMPDAVLVADRARAGELRSAVAALKARGAPQATGFARSYRPWGWYESLATGPGFQVKRIVVEPGGRLSLQSHRHRAEHWVVVGGTARVTLDGAVRLLEENRSVYIPQGAVHRLENPGRRPLVVIEVQTGSYLGEDDILRLEDAYARGPGGAGTADPQPDGGA